MRLLDYLSKTLMVFRLYLVTPVVQLPYLSDTIVVRQSRTGCPSCFTESSTFLMVRVACIHAMLGSLAPTARAFARGYPEAEVVNILDDSLSVDVGRAGTQEQSMQDRFSALGKYAREQVRADAILFTCSAFGAAIERVQEESSIPVLKPNSAMQREIIKRGGTVGVVSMFEPTLVSIVQELDNLRLSCGQQAQNRLIVVPQYVEGALRALQAGNEEQCADLIAREVADLIRREPHVSTVALAMFSMAFAKSKVEAACWETAISGSRSISVLTSPDSAVRELRDLTIAR